jgi:hypothetical protein
MRKKNIEDRNIKKNRLILAQPAAAARQPLSFQEITAFH